MSLSKTCWSGEAVSEKAGVGESKVGGVPDVPDFFEWPFFNGMPLEFVCQIRCKDIVLDNFPAEGLLLFFLCDGYWTDKLKDRDYIRVIHISPNKKLSPATTPVIEKRRLFGMLKPKKIPKIFREAKLVFSEAISIPDPESLPESFSIKMDEKDDGEAYCEIKEEISGKRFIQVGGYPNPIQYDGIAERSAKLFGLGEAEDWHMVLEVFSSPLTDMMWGDAGRIHFYAYKDDIDNLSFNNVWMEFQCH